MGRNSSRSVIPVASCLCARVDKGDFCGVGGPPSATCLSILFWIGGPPSASIFSAPFKIGGAPPAAPFALLFKIGRPVRTPSFALLFKIGSPVRTPSFALLFKIGRPVFPTGLTAFFLACQHNANILHVVARCQAPTTGRVRRSGPERCETRIFRTPQDPRGRGWNPEMAT